MRKIQWVCQWSISINKTAWVYDTGCEGLWHCQQFSLSVWGFISLLSHMLQDLRSYHIVHMYKPVWEQLVMLKIGNYRYYISLFKDNTAFMTYIWKQFHVKEVERESVDCLCFKALSDIVGVGHRGRCGEAGNPTICRKGNNPGRHWLRCKWSQTSSRKNTEQEHVYKCSACGIGQL